MKTILTWPNWNSIQFGNLICMLHKVNVVWYQIMVLTSYILVMELSNLAKSDSTWLSLSLIWPTPIFSPKHSWHGLWLENLTKARFFGLVLVAMGCIVHMIGCCSHFKVNPVIQFIVLDIPGVFIFWEVVTCLILVWRIKWYQIDAQNYCVNWKGGIWF